MNRRERDKNVRAAMHPLMFNSINELSLRIKSKVKDIDALRYGFSQLAQLCMTFELSRTKSFEFGSGNNKFKLCQMYSSKKLESEYYKAAENSTGINVFNYTWHFIQKTNHTITRIIEISVELLQ